MGYTLDDLDPRPQYENGASIVLSDEELEVVKNYRLLDARGRDMVRRCIANQLQYSGKGANPGPRPSLSNKTLHSVLHFIFTR